METIDRNELRRMIESNPEMALVEVLPTKSYREGHIPHAMSIPLDGDFDSKALEALNDKDRPIVVYCANLDCNASPDAGHRLEELGYTKVFDYAAGKKDWKDAGLELEATQGSGKRSN